MKKPKFLTLLASIATLGFFTTSCSKDDAPTISLLTVNGTEVTTTGQNIAATSGVAFPIKWAVTEGSKKLTKLVIRKGTADIATFTNADSIANGTYSATITTAGTYEFAVIVTDKGDNQSTSTFNVVVASGATANKYSAITLGAQTATPGSYFDFATGKVLGQTAAEAAGATVSYSFAGIGATPAATLIAPSARLANGLTKTSVGAENCYFQKNTTIDFSTATATEIAALTVSTLSPKFISVTTGDVVEFLTATGTKGLIHVTAVTNGVDGTITFDVK